MKYGKGTLTTIYDRVNFYRDVYSDPHVTFKREGDKITLISGDGTIINDKLIAKTEDVFDHKFDTYTPLKKQLNENQQIVLEYLKEMCPAKLGVSAMVTVYCLVDDNINDNWQEYSDEIPEHIEALQELSVAEENQVLEVFANWALEQEEE